MHDSVRTILCIFTSCGLFFIFGCNTPQRYFVVTPDKYVVNNPNTMHRYIVIDDKIVKQNENLFAQSIPLIESRNYKALETILTEYGPSEETDFIRLLMEMVRGKYKSAELYTHMIASSDYDCIIKLLKADVQYELERKRQMNDLEIMHTYQDALDCESSDERIDLIQRRVKHLRYKF